MSALRCPLALLVLLGASAASAQDDGALFPYHVGDRWVYEVEGVAPHNGREPRADTVDARVEWTLGEIRTGAEADTLVFDVVREGGRGYATRCAVAVSPGPEAYSLLHPLTAPEPSDPYDYWQCRVSAAFPMSAVLYPFVKWPDEVVEREVAVAGETLVREAGEATFTYSQCGPEPYCYDHEEISVRSTLVAGVGQVALEATYRGTSSGTPVRRDTLRARLLGADVGGVQYGSLRGTAAERGPGAMRALRVGPNPARSAATVWADAPGTLAVLDALGREVLRREVSGAGPVRLSVAGLPAGPYAVRLASAGGVRRARIVVVR